MKLTIILLTGLLALSAQAQEQFLVTGAASEFKMDGVCVQGISEVQESRVLAKAIGDAQVKANDECESGGAVLLEEVSKEIECSRDLPNGGSSFVPVIRVVVNNSFQCI